MDTIRYTGDEESAAEVAAWAPDAGAGVDTRTRALTLRMPLRKPRLDLRAMPGDWIVRGPGRRYHVQRPRTRSQRSPVYGGPTLGRGARYVDVAAVDVAEEAERERHRQWWI